MKVTCERHDRPMSTREDVPEPWCNLCDWEDMQAGRVEHAPWYGICSCGTGPAGPNGLCGPCTIASEMPWR